MQNQMEIELPGLKRVQAAATAPVKASTSEIGYAQAVNYNWWLYEEENTPELVWPQSVSVYDQMRRTDAQVNSVLEAVWLPVRRTPWRIDPNGARATVTKFVAGDLGLPIVGKDQKPASRTKGKFSWPEHLRMALLELVYGHMFFEQVYQINDSGTEAHLKKLAPRMPKTISRIDVASDGGLVSITQWWTNMNTEPRPIPVDRLVAYVRNREGGNWLGQSILRPAYKNWLIKDRLLRVQAQTVERNGMGIPLYKAQEGASETDLKAGKDMATLWRAGEAAGSAVPYGADLVLRGVEGTLPDADVPIRYHDEQIARAVLAHFLNLGTQTGSWALGTTFADFFVFSLQTLAQHIADVTTQHVIEDLVDLNFGPDEPAPKLVFDEIGSQQQATAQALKTLVDAGVLHPDEVLEGSTRQQYGLPPADPATATPPPGAATATPAEPVPGEMPGSVAAAAGVDTHPGGEQLKHWWVYGAGAARWRTFTELYDQLRAEIKDMSDERVKAIAAAWFHLRYGFWPGDHRNVHAAGGASPKADAAEAAAEADPEAEEWEALILALITALEELAGQVHAAFDPAKHPRNPKGSPGGGRFRSMVDRLKDAIDTHQKGGGSGHPLDGFDREQLRRVAKARGLELKRGESRDSIAAKLLDSLGQAPKPAEKPKAPRAPRKASPKRPSKADVQAAKAHVPAVVKTVAWANRDQVGRELERQAELTPKSLQKLHAVHLPPKGSEGAQEWLLSRAHSTSAYYTSLGSSPANYGKVAESDEKNPEIWLSPFWHSDQGHGPLSVTHRRSVEVGWHPPHGGELPISATVAHEYGHHIGQVFVGKMDIDGTASVTPEMADRFLTPLNEALGADRFGLPYDPNGGPWDTRRPDGDLLAPAETYSGYDVPGGVLERWMSKNRELITKKVSEYGAKNFHEMLAEIWTEYSTMGPSARPHIKVIGDLMRDIAEEARS